MVKIKSLIKFYNDDLVVRIIYKDEVLFTGKVCKIPEKLLSKNVVDINPTLNNRNKIVIELRLGRGEYNG